MGRVTLREAVEGDAAELGSLHVASWHETYRGILPDELLAGLSADSRAAMWRKILCGRQASGSTALFIAEDGDGMIGFGCCGEQRDETLGQAGFSGEISAIYILRSHQNAGVGRSLMAAMSRALLARGHRSASLWVLHENDRARAFYEAMGGMIVGEKVDERPGATLVEVAYGWRDLTRLGG
ncbi:MAG: GNAT family N-acetyltransferase [Sphingobium sp.]